MGPHSPAVEAVDLKSIQRRFKSHWGYRKVAMENSDDKMYEYLQMGAIEVVGIEEDGEFIFKITDLAKEVAPELWEVHVEEVDKIFMELFDMGLVNITYNENLEAEFELTQEGKRVAKEYGIVPIDDDI
jgi:hypothetical protein